MPVTNEQVATLRAQLSGDDEQYQRGFAKLETSADRAGYAALVAAAFTIATQQRFQPPVTMKDLIHFVSEIRGRSAGTAEHLEAKTAEQLLHAALTGEAFAGEPTVVGGHQIMLLAALVVDAQPTPDDLDALLAKARTIADRWIAEDAGESR